jgi:hypothetical protein
MARNTKSSGSQDLIGRISDTIAAHPRVSAAAAFQMGVLLGQAMQNAGALKGIGRKMAAASGAVASSIPTFGLFDSSPAEKAAPKTARASTRRSPAKRSKRTARA